MAGRCSPEVKEAGTDVVAGDEGELCGEQHLDGAWGLAHQVGSANAEQKGEAALPLWSREEPFSSSRMSFSSKMSSRGGY